MSKGEIFVCNLLDQAGIKYEREKTFDDLKHGLLRFDFYVYVDGGPAIIEWDGIQHFQFVHAFYSSKAQWQHIKEADRRKNSYCLAHNIPLYRVPYWDQSLIKQAKDLFADKYRVKSRWHNDEIKRP